MKNLHLNHVFLISISFFFFLFSSSFTPKKPSNQQSKLCSVVLDGGTCVGDVLTVRSSEPVRSITWMLDGVPILNQNIAQQNNGIVVAGGNGTGSAQNQFANPAAIFVDKDGNLFIPDMTNNRIQKWAPGATSGVTVAGGNGSGGGANQFNRPTGVAVDRNGNIYIADQNNRRVQKWVPGATSGTTVASGIGAPTRVCFDNSGNLYVSAQNDESILMFANATGSARIVAGGNGTGRSPNQLASPTGIFVDNNNNLYICDTDNTRIQKWVIGANSGTTVASLSTNPLGIYVDQTDNMYICDYTGYAVLKWTLGAPSGMIIAGGNGPGSNPNQIKPVGIFMDDYNNLFVSDFDNARVIKFSNIYTGSYTTLSHGVYTVKITTTSGCEVTSNPINIKAKANAQISITVDKSITCTNFPSVFTANSTNGGSNPTLQWKVNGIDVPNANASTFSSSTLKGNDVVSCSLTNLDPCVANTTVQSNNITLQDPTDRPSVQINLDANDICRGSLQTFEALPSNAGNNPSYQWLINGAPINGQNNKIFQSYQLQNDDVISCTINSNAPYCQATTAATSNAISVILRPIVIPEVSISTDEKKIYEDMEVTFTAVTINKGTYPTYTWKINGQIVYIGGDVFTTNNLQDQDHITCEVTINTLCASTNFVISNTLTIKVIKIEKVNPPSAFSPNGDGINDVWNIDELRMFPQCSVKIFSRNGVEIFNSIGYKKPWDGFHNTKASPPGVYYYVINLDGKQKITGSLTIIK